MFGFGKTNQVQAGAGGSTALLVDEVMNYTVQQQDQIYAQTQIGMENTAQGGGFSNQIGSGQHANMSAYMLTRAHQSPYELAPRYYSAMEMARMDVRGARPPLRQAVEEPSREMLTRTLVAAEEINLTDPRQKLAAEAEAVLGYTPLRRELRLPGTLRQVLARLEIAVLDEKSVDQYKTQMVAHYETAGKMSMPTWRLTPLKKYNQPVPEFVLMKAVTIKRELPEAEFYVDQLAVDPFLIVSLQELPDSIFNLTTRQLDPETAAYVEAWAEPKFEATL